MASICLVAMAGDISSARAAAERLPRVAASTKTRMPVKL